MAVERQHFYRTLENVNTNRTEMYYAVYTEAFHNYEYAKDYVKELANKAIKSIIYKVTILKQII